MDLEEVKLRNLSGFLPQSKHTHIVVGSVGNSKMTNVSVNDCSSLYVGDLSAGIGSSTHRPWMDGALSIMDGWVDI